MIQIIGAARKSFHYYRTLGKEFIENGDAKVRVTTMDVRPSPTSVGRIIRFVVINEVLRPSERNPIRIGSALALSFPPDKVNADSYRWFLDDPGEECMVPIKFKLTNYEHHRT